MREVLEHFDFDNTIAKLDEAGLLFKVVELFKNVDLHPDRVSNPMLEGENAAAITQSLNIGTNAVAIPSAILCRPTPPVRMNGQDVESRWLRRHVRCR